MDRWENRCPLLGFLGGYFCAFNDFGGCEGFAVDGFEVC
jgi:hypothetical protein